MKIKAIVLLSGFCLLASEACNHQKTKPLSNDITKTTVAVDGKKDSVINNPQKNYGNATVSEPCVKCLMEIIHATNNYKLITASVPSQNISYEVNWITSSKPVDIGNGAKIINGMAVDISIKDAGKQKKWISYLYNNENSLIYLRNDANNDIAEEEIGVTSLQKIRNSCFWGVASAK